MKKIIIAYQMWLMRLEARAVNAHFFGMSEEGQRALVAAQVKKLPSVRLVGG